MPSIALFVKQLMAEPLGSTKFTERLDERIKDMNAAQLIGMYEVLEKQAKEAKSDAWRSANHIIMAKMKPKLDLEVAKATFENKMYEEIIAKEAHKAELRAANEREAVRVQEMILQKCYEEARVEVNDKELKRQGEEKTEMIGMLFAREDIRNKRWMILAGVTILCIVLVSVIVALVANDSLLLAGLILCICTISALAAYRIYQLSLVFAKVIPEEEFERQREELAQLKHKKAMDGIREKERKFKETEYKDKMERRRMRAEKKQAQINAAKLLEERRLEHLRMAQEIKERKSSMTSNDTSVMLAIANAKAAADVAPSSGIDKDNRATENSYMSISNDGNSVSNSTSMVEEHKHGNDSSYRDGRDEENQLIVGTRSGAKGAIGSSGRGAAYIQHSMDDNNSISSLEMGDSLMIVGGSDYE